MGGKLQAILYPVVGASILYWQMIVEDTAQPILVVAGLALMGVSVPLLFDERRKNGNGKE